MEDTFDFMVNDEDEVMLLIFERSGTPQNPTFAVNPNDNTAILHRNGNDEIFLNINIFIINNKNYSTNI